MGDYKVRREAEGQVMEVTFAHYHEVLAYLEKFEFPETEAAKMRRGAYDEMLCLREVECPPEAKAEIVARTKEVHEEDADDASDAWKAHPIGKQWARVRREIADYMFRKVVGAVSPLKVSLEAGFGLEVVKKALDHMWFEERPTGYVLSVQRRTEMAGDAVEPDEEEVS